MRKIIFFRFRRFCVASNHLSLANDKRGKARVEIKRWSLAGNKDISRKAFLELKMLKVKKA